MFVFERSGAPLKPQHMPFCEAGTDAAKAVARRRVTRHCSLSLLATAMTLSTAKRHFLVSFCPFPLTISASLVISVTIRRAPSLVPSTEGRSFARPVSSPHLLAVCS